MTKSNQKTQQTKPSTSLAMPSTLPPEMSTEFHDLIRHLEQRNGLVRTEDLPLIEALLFHRYAVRMAFEDLTQNGLVIDGKANPAAAAMAIQTGAVTKMAAALALGPAHRAKLKAPSSPTPAAGNPWSE